ncbi:hypothetical protein ACHHYP_05853 [Achlya hypogyna]|uniref:Ankyrin repeat protein n=1 Tax=Achlya hypogyna TaxID=1202772 RepID=A0A1V9YWN3_ACHHY|nr:hypothetical protein ACHHYP_05853 [Achlya hypogyna]
MSSISSSADVAFTVLTNGPLTSMILSYQYGVTKELSVLCLAHRRKLKRRPLASQKQLILSQSDMFRGYLLLKLLEKDDLANAKELLRQRPTGYIAPPVESSYIYGLNNATRLRDLDMVKFLHENELSKATKDAMDTAAELGDLETVKYLHENRKEGCSLVAFVLAERHGHNDVVEFLTANRPRDRNACPSADPKLLMIPAIISNTCNIHNLLFIIRHWILRYVLHYPEKITAYQNGVTHSLSTIMHSYHQRLTRRARIDKSARTVLATPNQLRCYVLFQLIHRRRFFECHQLIRELRGAVFETPVISPCKFPLDMAAAQGDLELVQFLSERRLGNCSKNAMDEAAANGDLSMVRYLHEHETAGCSLVAFLLAKKNGHNEVLAFLKAERPRDRDMPPQNNSNLLYMVPVVATPVAVGVTIAVAACTIQ